MIYVKTFKLSSSRVRNPNIYPYNVFNKHEGAVLLFNKTTILYGNNGSGKSSLLNLIANKLNIKGAERFASSGCSVYVEKYLSECSFQMGDRFEEGECDQTPHHNMYIKSEDILYEVKKIQQESVLKESYLFEQAKTGLSKKQLDQFEHSPQFYKQIEIMKFANEKYSNGETSMQWFDEHLVANGLYLLDEPETSLSPANQIRLAHKLNELVRFFDCQFIIATHSPFMLGTLEGIIYDLDHPQLPVRHWFELENMKLFYQFFKERKDEFES